MARAVPNYIPRPDGDFDAWARNFWLCVDDFSGPHALPPAMVAALENALNAWTAAYPAAVAARAAAESATKTKVEARAALDAAIRPLAGLIQALPTITDPDRAKAGLTVRDTTPTPPAAPTTRPKVSVEIPARLTHRLRLADEATPTRSRRPRGTRGAEVWLGLVGAGEPAPLDPAALRYLTTATRPVVRTDFRAEDGGKTAVYMLRWVGSGGEKGPWSEVCAVTVAA